jgi:hypothetical protein
MFLSLSGEDPDALYSLLVKTPSHRLISDEKIYAGWNTKIINKGSYFYAFSHTPVHELTLPSKTFTISCFRDPVKRVVSYYNMLMEFRRDGIDHPCMKNEGKHLDKGFDNFLDFLSKEHLLNQLYTFSSDYNINEAVDNVSQLSHYFFTDQFDEGIDVLNLKTGLSLKQVWIRKSNFSSPISDHSLEKLRGMLDKEYRFLDRIRSLKNE